MNDSPKEIYFYRLLDPETGLYLATQEVDGTDYDPYFGPELKFATINDKRTVFRNLEDVAKVQNKSIFIERAIETLSMPRNTIRPNYSAPDLIDVPGVKEDILINKKMELKEISKKLSTLELTIFQLSEIHNKEKEEELLSNAKKELLELKIKKTLEENIGSLLLIREWYRPLCRTDFLKIFDHYKELELPNIEQFTHIIFGGEPDSDSTPKVSVNLSGLKKVFKNLGLNYHLLNQEEFCGYALLSQEDLNLLEISNPDTIICTLEIAKVKKLELEIRKNLESLSK